MYSYKVTVYSCWESTSEHFFHTLEDAKAFRWEMREAQYLTAIEQLEHE